MRNFWKFSKKSFVVILTALLVVSGSVSIFAASKRYTVKVNNGSASTDNYTVSEAVPGERITLKAMGASSGQVFDRWEYSTTPSAVYVRIGDRYASTTTFDMPEAEVVFTATYTTATGYTLTVKDGTIMVDERYVDSGSRIAPGKKVTIKAAKPSTGKAFDRWTSRDVNRLKDEKAAETTFEMPSYNVEFVATYKIAGEQILTLRDASATIDGRGFVSGDKVDAGKAVTVTAAAAPTGKVFDRWTSNSAALIFADVTAAVTTFTMPGTDITVTATYKDVAVQPKKQVITFIIGSTGYVVNNAGQAETKIMEAAPFLQDGRTMLPLRYAGEALGAQVAWDPATRQATCTLEGTTVIVTLGSKTMLVNGKAMEMDVAPAVVAGRTFLPMKWIGVALGVGDSIKWDQTTKSATIEKFIK